MERNHNARSSTSSPTHSSVILNEVKDLRLFPKNPFNPIHGNNRPVGGINICAWLRWLRREEQPQILHCVQDDSYICGTWLCFYLLLEIRNRRLIYFFLKSATS
jgi:hypothetical protein